MDELGLEKISDDDAIRILVIEVLERAAEGTISASAAAQELDTIWATTNYSKTWDVLGQFTLFVEELHGVAEGWHTKTGHQVEEEIHKTIRDLLQELTSGQ